MKKDKRKALELLKQKINGEIIITYSDISKQSGYSRMQISRLNNNIEKKDIEVMLVHGLTGKPSNNSAPTKEIEFIKNFKNQYPKCSISQFQDIYNEDIIFNPKNKMVVNKNKLVKRSESFFQQLYKKEQWKSPIKHKCFKGDKDIHSLRVPMSKRGMLIMTDGTPHDWFSNGNKFSLHLVLDDATGEILAGWFMPTECQYGYCMTFKIMFEKYGIPQVIYSDRTTILWDNKEDNKTQVARMLDELGIELIFANSPEAKGKIEKMNNTIQNRLLNDIIRFNIKTYDQLNKWFNDTYIYYINTKFSYLPKEQKTEFVLLDNTDLTKIMCLKEKRIILNGNMISYKNDYYMPINIDENNYIFYKGTEAEIWVDIFTYDVRIFKNNKIYNTKKIEGHFKDPKKREQKLIQNQKDLEQVLRERENKYKKNLS